MATFTRTAWSHLAWYSVLHVPGVGLDGINSDKTPKINGPSSRKRTKRTGRGICSCRNACQKTLTICPRRNRGEGRKEKEKGEGRGKTRRREREAEGRMKSGIERVGGSEKGREARGGRGRRWRED